MKSKSTIYDLEIDSSVSNSDLDSGNYRNFIIREFPEEGYHVSLVLPYDTDDKLVQSKVLEYTSNKFTEHLNKSNQDSKA